MPTVCVEHGGYHMRLEVGRWVLYEGTEVIPSLLCVQKPGRVHTNLLTPPRTIVSNIVVAAVLTAVPVAHGIYITVYPDATTFAQIHGLL